MGAVWISCHVTESVMLAMYGNPLLGNHAGCEPQPKTHEVFKHRRKNNASMCLSTMQVKSDTHYGNVRHYQCG
jgi:hypothetical protein